MLKLYKLRCFIIVEIPENYFLISRILDKLKTNSRQIQDKLKTISRQIQDKMKAINIFTLSNCIYSYTYLAHRVQNLYFYTLL